MSADNKKGTGGTLLVVGVRTLGSAIALHFGERGWRVIAASRTRADVDRLAADVDAAGGQGVGVTCDLLDRSSLDAVTAAHPDVDLCVVAQTAGGRFGALPLLEIEDGELERGFQTYVRGTWNLLKSVGPNMIARGSGTFLQIGTSSGLRTKDGFAALGTTQHALRALVQVAAREWRAHGVHVAYVPIDGPIESHRTRDWLARNGADRAIPQGEIARACAYLHEQQRGAWTHEMVLRPTAGDWTAPT
jgi:NAD(P)-dependent dehydrogenase (short-subunit alcohol dehydrogenase family)